MAATPARLRTSSRPTWWSSSAATRRRVIRCWRRASSARTSCDGQKLIVSDLREHEMARRADIFLHPTPGTDLIWLSAVSRYLLDNGLAQHRVPRAVGEWIRRVPEEPRAVHAGVRSRAAGLPRGDARSRWRTMIADGEARLHSLGDGRHAAQQRLRHLDRDLESAAGHRQLHAAGHRRLSAARAQQRAGRERQRLDAEHSARLPVGRRSGGAAHDSRRPGASRCRPPRAWTITRWSTPSTRAS